jgi:heme/copper-type cytochrome/quinol oxidase subunit 2
MSFNGLSNETAFGALRFYCDESWFFANKKHYFCSPKLSNSSNPPAEKLYNMRPYSYDSTMLSEDDVLRSNGSKARLLSVDKPLYLPANTLLTISVTAYDVIHSWTVPSFGVKLDGCPGRANTVSFSVKRTGIYYGQCSEICGVNHAFMPIEVRVYNIDDFLTQIAK